jgi:ribosomal peptide maturation radical SAM protein 1
MQESVLLLSMPFGALERPALGLSLLKAGLASAGVECEVRYLTFAFAELIGHAEYVWLTTEVPYTAFAGDWAFTPALYGSQPDLEARYVQEVLCDTWRLDRMSIDRILRIRSMVPHFLDYCLAALRLEDHAIVGFTSTFEQNIASLALAGRIKRVSPETSIVFGGANWEADMGLELHRQFPFIDYVCSGEADSSFPLLVRQILDAEPMLARVKVPGLVYRLADQSVATGPPDPIHTLDSLPVPDYTEYFGDLHASSVGASVVPTLLVETSRGCWWGAKSHCTFCGLNGGNIAFRRKAGERAITEIEYLVDRWQVEHVEAVDNILDMRYFDDMLPRLAASDRPIRLFYEVKANLTRRHVKALHEAGVYRIQPGIESLSDHVLKLMRKGTTALQNIQLLKWCREYGVQADWNILYGFPGETAQDYADILRLLPAIRFLGPPAAWGPIRLDRFSPYFEDPHAFGLRNVRPIRAYNYLYPFDARSLGRIAYYFDFDYQPGLNPSGYAAEVIAYVKDWQQQPEMGQLQSVCGSDDNLVLLDTRAGATQPHVVLSGLEQAAYELCDAAHSPTQVVDHLGAAFPGVAFTSGQVREFLDSLVANSLMVTDGVRYLSLALQRKAAVAV